MTYAAFPPALSGLVSISQDSRHRSGLQEPAEKTVIRRTIGTGEDVTEMQTWAAKGRTSDPECRRGTLEEMDFRTPKTLSFSRVLQTLPNWATVGYLSEHIL
jgi:hypothetical protein